MGLIHQLNILRIWIVLPGRGTKSGQKVVFPISLARLLHQRASDAGYQPEALLAELLKAAIQATKPSDPVDLAWSSLTAREQEVACLIAAGLCNQEIAARLMISRTTVRTHARYIIRKFGCTNRRELPDLSAFCCQRGRDR